MAHSRCRYSHLQRDFTIEDLAAFHGHLGPFLVIGYRMGRYARKTLCHDPFALSARVYCSGTTPETCIADGLQMGSGCTMGKNNIEIIPDADFRCEIEYDGRTLLLRPLAFEKPPRDDFYEENIERIAVEMSSMPDGELFSVEKTAPVHD
jgi:formylmethanofuran dehydrogenase subunit E